MTARPLICFDWDGTLADSMRLCIEECRYALLKLGLPDLPDETLMLCNGPNDWDACEILGIPEALKGVYVPTRIQAGLDLTPTVNKLFPGVKSMLETLSQQADLAIVSNGQMPYIRLCKKTFGLEQLFRTERAYTPGLNKGQLLQQVLDEVQPSRAIMVGDRLGDLQAGRQCGLPTVAAAYGYGTPEEWAEADVCCESVEALTDYLLQWATQTEIST